MLYTSYIELSKKALQNNIAYMKNIVNSNVRYSMVIKSNAYGHGIASIVPLVESCGVDHLAVFSTGEAEKALAAKSDSCDLMIMGFVDDIYLDWVIENDISFYVFTQERLQAVAEVVKRTRKPARIHIEIETGMYRTGLIKQDLEFVRDILIKNKDRIILEGICTHFAGAEAFVNFPRVRSQIRTFKERCDWFEKHGIKPRYKHTCCSAGVFNFQSALFDLVRVGIANYGLWPSNETKMHHLETNELELDPLDQVLSWKSKIISINTVPEGEYVSYGTSYLTNRESKIAIIPVGYGYGFSRNLSNNGHVLINSKRVPVIGAVNMNMMVVDATDLPNVEINDEVVLIGRQGNLKITVSSFSDMNNSMNYELLASLPYSIPRKCID